MSTAILGMIALFNEAKQMKGISGHILGFSITHNDRQARIYGYYPLLVDNIVHVYRHEFKGVDVHTHREEKWTSFHFVENIYRIFAPQLWNLIGEALERLPDTEKESRQGVRRQRPSIETTDDFEITDTADLPGMIDLPDENDEADVSGIYSTEPPTKKSRSAKQPVAKPPTKMPRNTRASGRK